MQAELQSVLDLQPRWTRAAPSEDMELRGLYIRGDIADFVRDHEVPIASRLLCPLEDLEIEGKDGSGHYARVPWARFANRQLSENPREGWYAVYLFAEDGSEAALSLNQGTQVWDGSGMRSRPEASIRIRSEWARARLSALVNSRPRLATAIHLGDADKSRAYEAGNVFAYRYPSGAIPPDTDLEVDLLDMADLLQALYRAEATSPVPGDGAPEVGEAERAAQDLAGRRVPGRSAFRTKVKQRKAIELRAMTVAAEHFRGLGAAVKDVSASKSYDLDVTLGQEHKTVEVKGTAGDGAEILLTRGEVKHHQRAYPENALAVVSTIRLVGPPDAPAATGGKLRIIEPWQIDIDRLMPIAYRYPVGEP